MKKLRLLDLFSGIGGFSLGLERTGGFETVAFCEIEAFPRRVLNKHWPEVPIYNDIRDLTAARLGTDGIGVDAICGGFPCTDISSDGQGAGISGEYSGLWFEYARLISELRPSVVFVENVAELLGNGMGDVLGSLASIRYDAEWHSIPASYVGAPHIRDRVWILAYPENKPRLYQPNGRENSDRLCHNAVAWPPSRWNAPEDCVCRMEDGISRRVDCASALGNAVVPQIPELLGRAYLESIGWTAEQAA
ncbi:MAG: DNA cytosine methyltransferase [Pseudomonadota bacterium]